MDSVLKREFKSNLNLDNGYKNNQLGEHSYTMELFKEDENHYLIEWDIPGLDCTEHIGIGLQNNRLIDYDGVFELPEQAIKILREAGITVPREFENK